MNAASHPRLGPSLRLTTLVLMLICSFNSPAFAKLQDTRPLEQDWNRALAKSAEIRAGVSFPWAGCFRKAARQHGVSEALLLAVARGESDFKARAVSHANAVGVMQILWPQTARHLGIYRRSQLYDPCTNIDAGARYLKEMLARYDGRVHLALAAYNYGPGRIAVDARRIPGGADWYSRYILRHYGYVTGRPRPSGTGSVKRTVSYHQERKLELIRFDRPYRAEAFVELLKSRSPQLRLDWFRLPDYHYKVVALYRSSAQLKQIEFSLRRLGIDTRAKR